MTYNWKILLAQWSRDLLGTELAGRLESEPMRDDWLGFDPAGEEEILKLEKRLGVLLPPSYKAFLKISNGWQRTTPFIGRIRPTAEVDWFRVENENWVEVYQEARWNVPDEEYFAYGEQGQAAGHRPAHMPSLLQISDVDDGVYLLNPEAVTPDSEWEAWFFANWVPGARRYPSFEHLLWHDYLSFRSLEEIQTALPSLPALKVPGFDVPRVQAERICKNAVIAKTLEALIAGLEEDRKKERDRAVRAFAGKLKGRNRARRRPQLAEKLSELFYRSPHADVRSVCIAAITELAEDTPPLQSLLDSLSDPDPGVVLSGMFALRYFPDARAVEPLCRFVDSRMNVLFNETAMQIFGEMGDPLAIPTLRGVLFEMETQFEQSIGSAGYALGRCGPKGVDVLIEAMHHVSPTIRRAAVVGIDISGDPRASELLHLMAADPDETVRQRAAVRSIK